MARKTDNAPGWNEFTPLRNPADNSPQHSEQLPAQTTTYVRQRGSCQFCKSRRFLRSGLRGSDIGSLFFLRYPVRCLRCRQRQFTDFLTASLSQPAGSPVYSAAKKRENWGAWTRGSDRDVVDSWNKAEQPARDIPPSSQ